MLIVHAVFTVPGSGPEQAKVPGILTRKAQRLTHEIGQPLEQEAGMAAELTQGGTDTPRGAHHPLNDSS
jgi:hypothetical protein